MQHKIAIIDHRSIDLQMLLLCTIFGYFVANFQQFEFSQHKITPRSIHCVAVVPLLIGKQMANIVLISVPLDFCASSRSEVQYTGHSYRSPIISSLVSIACKKKQIKSTNTTAISGALDLKRRINKPECEQPETIEMVRMAIAHQQLSHSNERLPNRAHV